MVGSSWPPPLLSLSLSLPVAKLVLFLGKAKKEHQFFRQSPSAAVKGRREGDRCKISSMGAIFLDASTAAALKRRGWKRTRPTSSPFGAQSEGERLMYCT